MGRITDVVSTTTEMPSRKQPSTTKNTVSAAISATGESPSAAIHSASARGMPV
ncbi:hypothetical protein KBTX_04082 [wastewater metagenome]|uniref:Uncharacterized protein n=2 Tax=unclassified sequences TaxID=12908 RepID=A0A5B8RGG0_9ZZZZ|nr:hypothetical protein KBTEX_04082 [uncultured organism]